MGFPAENKLVGWLFDGVYGNEYGELLRQAQKHNAVLPTSNSQEQMDERASHPHRSTDQ